MDPSEKKEWTPERVEQLKKLWGKGMTASEIAKVLEGVTRNAVIGKAHRLGLPRRPSPIKQDKPQRPTIHMLTERMCRWPIGHPGEDDFHFCGKPVETGRPYCTEHCAVAYRRKDDNAA